jgi:tetratricopeptide (TPR) repeat protein
MIIRIFFTILLVFLVQCTHFAEDKPQYNIDYPSELKDLNELILKNKTDDARIKIDDYLNKSENIHWFGHAYFLKAFLYEMDENYDEAIKNYRSAIQHSSHYDSKVEAKALYNLSFVYEKLDKKSELLVALVDLMKRREFFDILTGQVEIPARLAATYFSIDKVKEAKIFHREASQNFESMVRRQHFSASKEELSKSLYYLGAAIFDVKNEKFETEVLKMNFGQKYFLASAEASKSSWADKSTDRLLYEYNKLWNLIQTLETNDKTLDPQAQSKQVQMNQLEMASDFYDLLLKLRAEEFPLTNVNKRSKEIMDESKKWLRKIEKFSLKLNLGPDMIRSSPVKNKKLSTYIEEKKEPVKINKELSRDEVVNVSKDKEKKLTKPQEAKLIDSKNLLPLKEVNKNEIGEDPNL